MIRGESDISITASEEEEEQGSNDLNGDGEDYSDPVSPYMRQYEDSHSFVVSLLYLWKRGCRYLL